MRIEYHPAVDRDVAEALRRYETVSPRLAKEFETELRLAIAEQPRKIPPDKTRAAPRKLKRFPYHFVYRELVDGTRVTLVRHHRRKPDLGIERD